MEAFRKAIASKRKGYILAKEMLSRTATEDMLLELEAPTTAEARRIEILTYLLDATSPVTMYGTVDGADPTRKNIVAALPDEEFSNKHKAIWDANGVRVYNKGNNCLFVDTSATTETEEGDGKLLWKDKPRGKWADAADTIDEVNLKSMLSVVDIFKHTDFREFTTELGMVHPAAIIASEIVRVQKYPERTLRSLFFMTDGAVVTHVFNTAGLRAIHLWFGKPVEELTCHLLVGNEVKGQPTVALLVTDGVTTAALAYMVID